MVRICIALLAGVTACGVAFREDVPGAGSGGDTSVGSVGGATTTSPTVGAGGSNATTNAATTSVSAGAGGMQVDPPTMAALDGVRVELPCGMHLSDPPWGCPASAESIVVVADGDPNTTYMVTLRVRGVVEQNAYTAGMPDSARPFFHLGGQPDNEGWNVVRLAVTSPVTHYFLNAGDTDIPNCFGIDYTITIPIAGGATVSLLNDAKDGAQVINIDDQGMPITMGTISGFAQPYDGQWIQLDVVSVTL